MKRPAGLLFSLLSIFSPLSRAAETDTQPNPLPGWPPEVGEVFYPSHADGTLQPTLFYDPKSDAPAPLLVALHTWSGNYKQAQPAYAEWCIRKGWILVHPNFRGPNKTPEACGSDLVVEDILSVVNWARKTARVDPDRIYLMGASGGGYASMLLAGRAPQVWAGVSAWCGIFDLRHWHAERKQDGYAKMMEAACGGAPGTSPTVDEQYGKRSASTWLTNASGLPLDLNTGIWDGHKGSVPVSHSLNAFNVLAAPADRIPAEQIHELTVNATVPEARRFEGSDPVYGKRPVLYRNISGNCRITVFEGAHDMVVNAGLRWLEQQRKGQAATWKVEASEADRAEAGTAVSK